MYNSWLVIIFTLFIAIVLTLLPMPQWALWIRPAWVLMVLIYWNMMAPYQINVGAAWIIGILLDLLNGTLLGEHALALTAVVYLVSRLHMRLRTYPLVQQGLFILFFVFLYQFIIYCIQGFIGRLPTSHLFWLAPISSMLLWPWLYVILRDSQKWFKFNA